MYNVYVEIEFSVVFDGWTDQKRTFKMETKYVHIRMCLSIMKYL